MRSVLDGFSFISEANTGGSGQVIDLDSPERATTFDNFQTDILCEGDY